MTLKGGTSQACAACKYQRRRCLPECQLAPYFPADQPKMFQNAHRLFGVSNILKILKDLDPSIRPEAMKSIIFESNIRNKFPVLGCYGYISELEYHVRIAEEELQMIRSHIAMCKMQQCQNVDEGQVLIDRDYKDDTVSMLHLQMGPPANNKHVNETMMFQNDGLMENDHFWDNSVQVNVQQHFDLSKYQYQLVNEIQLDHKLNKNLVHQFEGMHAFFDGIEDRPSFDSEDSARL